MRTWVVEVYSQFFSVVYSPWRWSSVSHWDFFVVVVVEQMRERQEHRPNMEFAVMDATQVHLSAVPRMCAWLLAVSLPCFSEIVVVMAQTPFATGEFDCVFDKSLFDCLLCGSVQLSFTFCFFLCFLRM